MAQGPRRSLWCTGSTFTLLPYAQLERCDEALDAVAAFEEAVERDHWLEGYRKAVLDV